MSLPSNWSQQLSSITGVVPPLPHKSGSTMKMSHTSTCLIKSNSTNNFKKNESSENHEETHGGHPPQPIKKGGLTRSSSVSNTHTLRGSARSVINGQAQQRAFLNYTNKQTNMAQKIIDDDFKFDRRQRTRSMIVASPVKLQSDQFQDNKVAEEVFHNAKKSNHNIPMLPKSKLPNELTLKDGDSQRVFYWG